jgi:hypothetical protein
MPYSYEGYGNFAELIETLAPAEYSVLARCDLQMGLPTSTWRTTFTLPWPMFTADANTPFDEVRGVRVAKRSKDDTLWTAICDVMGDEIMLSTFYTARGLLQETLFADIIRRGIEVAARLVRPRGDSN